MNEMRSITRQSLATYFRDRLEEHENTPQIARASERFRAIDLSCRACGACGVGAECWAWIPVWGPSVSLPQTPIYTYAC